MGILQNNKIWQPEYADFENREASYVFLTPKSCTCFQHELCTHTLLQVNFLCFFVSCVSKEIIMARLITISLTSQIHHMVGSVITAEIVQLMDVDGSFHNNFSGALHACSLIHHLIYPSKEPSSFPDISSVQTSHFFS